MGGELRIRLDDFGVSALAAEAARQRVSVEDLARHAVIYYLGDLDSGRLTRATPRIHPVEPAVGDAPLATD
jgi:hypothetical protein